MMGDIPISLFLYISKLIHLQNPLLLMSENEVIPVPFCTGVSLPIACHQYSAGDMIHAAKQLHYSSTADKEVSPVFLYGEEHKELLRELSTKPLAFTNTTAYNAYNIYRKVHSIYTYIYICIYPSAYLQHTCDVAQ